MSASTLIVADIEHSALSIAALSRSNFQDARVIHALDFLTPESLLKELIKRKPQLILLIEEIASSCYFKVCFTPYNTLNLTFLRFVTLNISLSKDTINFYRF